MALIEGVGDEVTVLFAVLACLLVLALAWVSTHTAEGSDPLPQPPGTPVPAQPSEAMAATDSIRGEAPGAETPSLRHRSQAAQPEPGVTATPPPPDSPQEPLVLRLKFLNDSEQVARAWPHDTIGSLKRSLSPQDPVSRPGTPGATHLPRPAARRRQPDTGQPSPPSQLRSALPCVNEGRFPTSPLPTGVRARPLRAGNRQPAAAPAAAAAAPALVLPDPVPALLSPDRHPGPSRLHPAPQSSGLCHVPPIVPPRALGGVANPSGPHSPRRGESCCLPRPASPACLFPLPWSPALRRRGLRELAEARPCDLHGSGPLSGAAGPQPSLTVGSSGSGTCCRCLGPGQSRATPWARLSALPEDPAISSPR
uniref:Transmembrane and ubiquitin like domain containing 1 n=1 Tax=Sciurus vulgaris TaxID=55149 RepID=A0A8D2B270_SCIVU